MPNHANATCEQRKSFASFEKKLDTHFLGVCKKRGKSFKEGFLDWFQQTSTKNCNFVITSDGYLSFFSLNWKV